MTPNKPMTALFIMYKNNISWYGVFTCLYIKREIMKNYTSYWTNTHIRQTNVFCYKQMPRLFLLLVKQMSIVSSTAKQMSMSNVKFYYLSYSILDFGNLMRPGRSATRLIKNQNYTHITLGGPIEQKNFDRHKRQKNCCILRLKITLVDFFPLLKK